MRTILIAAAAIGLSTAAWAGGPTLMSDTQMDQVVAGTATAWGTIDAGLTGGFNDTAGATATVGADGAGVIPGGTTGTAGVQGSNGDAGASVDLGGLGTTVFCTPIGGTSGC